MLSLYLKVSLGYVKQETLFLKTKPKPSGRSGLPFTEPSRLTAYSELEPSCGDRLEPKSPRLAIQIYTTNRMPLGAVKGLSAYVKTRQRIIHVHFKYMPVRVQQTEKKDQG